MTLAEIYYMENCRSVGGVNSILANTFDRKPILYTAEVGCGSRMPHDMLVTMYIFLRYYLIPPATKAITKAIIEEISI
jgi:hypothetical protein